MRLPPCCTCRVINEHQPREEMAACRTKLQRQTHPRRIERIQLRRGGILAMRKLSPLSRVCLEGGDHVWANRFLMSTGLLNPRVGMSLLICIITHSMPTVGGGFDRQVMCVFLKLLFSSDGQGFNRPKCKAFGKRSARPNGGVRYTHPRG